MAYSENIYEGASYGLEPPTYGNTLSSKNSYQIAASQIGMATDARTSNQVQEVQKKLRTGAKTIEISMALDPGTLDSMPKQQFKEINRLKKLAGVDLTFHGPIIEPSGFNQRGGNWDEAQRQQAENHIMSAVERGHELDPKGNIVITFHSAYSFPETNPKIINKKGEEEETGVYVIDEESGKMGLVQKKEQKLLGKTLKAEDLIKDYNETRWSGQLESINRELIFSKQRLEAVEKELGEEALKALKYSKGDKKEYEKFLSVFTPDHAKSLNHAVEILNESEIGVRDVYNGLNELFNLAYKRAEAENREKDIAKLEDLKKEIGKTIEVNKGNPLQFIEFSNQVSRGIRALSDISTPIIFNPLKEFVLDKGSDTYANVAFNAFKKYKEYAPIISIENPPAGGALSKAEDLKEMIKMTREKFIEKAKADGMSPREAKEQAEMLIGATWDVGHINMLRKFGYKKEHLLEQAKTIAPFVKHVHLSDNFGMEHTELPMGMGNVPTEETLKIIGKYNDKVKKISETGGQWYQFFRKEPLLEQFRELNTPVYSSQGSPTWTDTTGMMGTYFSGMGNIFPEQHVNIFGAGYTPSIPPELGGQVGGNRSSFSNTPME